MRSIVLRADPQMMSNTTDRVWVCCFCIFAHFGQTEKYLVKKEQMQILNQTYKKKSVILLILELLINVLITQKMFYSFCKK